jgi:hypothetical protein
MRSIVLAALAALALGPPASAVGYHVDGLGACHAPDGHIAPIGMCKVAWAQCRDPKTGHYVNCPTHPAGCPPGKLGGCKPGLRP